MSDTDQSKKIKRLASFLQKNPEDSFTKFALALELLKMDEVSKARVLFESVLKQDPDYLGVYYHLGKLYEHTGRLHDASNLYRTGIELAEKQRDQRTRLELIDALESVMIDLNHENQT